LTSASPTIFALQTDSAWIVILVVSAVTLAAALICRRIIRRPGGVASGLLLCLPLVLPLMAAALYQQGVLPEIGVLRPAGPAVLERSEDLLHLLWLADDEAKVITPYALWGSAGPWLLLVGAGISSFMLVRRFIGALMVHRLVRRCENPTTEQSHLIATAERLVEASRLARPVELLILPPGVSGAFAIGARRPRILVSEDLVAGLDEDETEAILAHEIAHLEAKDVRLVFIAGLVRDVVAWNPFGHIAFRRLAADREIEADRRAAGITGKPLAVASGLLKVWELMRAGRRSRHRIVLAFLRPGWRISRRVSNLIAAADGRVALVPTRGRMPFVVAGCLVAALGLEAGARIAGQKPGAFAIVWGTPRADAGEVWAPIDTRARERGVATEPGRQDGKRGRRAISRARYRYFLRSLSVHERDFPAWIELATKLARQRKGMPTAWNARHDWRAIPMLPETLGVGIYTLEEGLPPLADILETKR
jgi:Zn-dependent protease with chaperone function